MCYLNNIIEYKIRFGHKQAASGGRSIVWARGGGVNRVRKGAPAAACTFSRRASGGRSVRVGRDEAIVGGGQTAQARAHDGVGRWADGGRLAGPEGGGHLCPAGNARARVRSTAAARVYLSRARIIPVFFFLQRYRINSRVRVRARAQCVRVSERARACVCVYVFV